MSHGPSKLEDLADPPTEEELNRLQLTTLQYYLHETNPANGLVRDKTAPKAPCSIAAVGLALATIPVVVERGVVSREFAPEVVLRKLRFFRDSPQGPEPDATGYRGFYSLEWVKRWDLSLEEPGIAFAHYKQFMDALE